MFTSRVLPADWDTRLDLMHHAGLFFFCRVFFSSQWTVVVFFNSLHNVIRNLRVNIKTEKHLRIIFFAYRKSSPLNYASVCSLLATSELLLSLCEHRVLMRRPALTRLQKGCKAGCQMRPSRADGVAEPTSPAKASENLTSFLQKNKTNKRKIDTQNLDSLGIRRAAARTDRRSHGSRSKSLSIRRHAQPRLIWLSCSKFPGQERKQRSCPSTIIVELERLERVVQDGVKKCKKSEHKTVFDIDNNFTV